MSQENVDVVQATLAVWNGRDTDGFRELLDPDVILRNPDGWPEPGPFLGREAVMRQFAEAREIWDADAMELISDCIHAADRVAVRAVWHGSGHGVESHLEFTIVFTVRRGRIFGLEYFWDHGEALDAVGLSE